MLFSLSLSLSFCTQEPMRSELLEPGSVLVSLSLRLSVSPSLSLRDLS